MPRWVLGLVALAALVVASPWIAFQIGLANVEGKPLHSAIRTLSPAQLEFLHVATRKAGVFKVPELTPLGYVMDSVQDPDKLASGGVKTAWIVARHHAANHLKRTDEVSRRLSETALMIWLTQNWSSDQIIARAYEIELARAGKGGRIE